MTIPKNEFAEYIKSFDFRGLFIEGLGWNNDNSKVTVSIDDKTYTLHSVAQKSGFRILVCDQEGKDLIPQYTLRRRIEAKVVPAFHDHLIIFIDHTRNEQIWQLAVRTADTPLKITELTWYSYQTPELLYQRTSGLLFELDEEDHITIVDVTARVSSHFNVNSEKVTKRFYERFRKEHDAFEKFIKGIEDKVNRDWYASLMLNRLMFCYFIQKRRFLNNDMDYLKHKLQECRDKHGKNKFYSFYRNFLLTLFHQGLGAPVHSEELTKEIGRIPYLNGGLFDTHEIETAYPKIDIADEAFEAIFKFFDDFTWHLDTRPDAAGNEVNPDVIGYIFEKYINDRASMGAYYTKEDITEYIAKNCVIPRLFDKAARDWPHPFVRDGEAWRLLRESGDAYIYDAVKKGISSREQGLRDAGIPPNISVGLDTETPNLLERRKDWNTPTPPEFGLPTEIWRETIARWRRYFEVRDNIRKGALHGVNDCITYNLNIRQFAQDLIEQTEDAALVKAFWDALTEVTILDPTCGSGAFLFAALNVLEPLYESCIMRMRGFVEDEDRANSANKSSFRNELAAFREALACVQNPRHPNQKYFIYKSIILNNLYGVDLMKEAVEIAKLRLFLKLVAAVEADYRKSNLGLEPLPDIDFNIRSGNTLVGFATQAEIEKAFAGKLGLFNKELQEILTSCDGISAEFEYFQKIQLVSNYDSAMQHSAKAKLQKSLLHLRSKLDRYLYNVYDQNFDAHRFANWKETHRPFHWFAEFYQIIAKRGGFDVVIGNPPYVEYSEKKIDTNLTNHTNNYRIMGYKTESCGNLYAFVVERTNSLTSNNSNMGMIIPMSVTSIRDYEDLRSLLRVHYKNQWISNHAIRPSSLFVDISQRVSILLAQKKEETTHQTFYTTHYLRNKSDARLLFEQMQWQCVPHIEFDSIIPKLGVRIEETILKKIRTDVFDDCIPQSEHKMFIKDYGETYWIFPFSFTPYLTPVKSFKELYFKSEKDLKILTAIYNSNLFYWFYTLISDCWHFGKWHMQKFGVSARSLSDIATDLQKWHDRLVKSYQENRITRFDSRIRGDLYEYKIAKSKPIIDEIDKVLAKHYGFTEEELDFIINYDIKYRMGLTAQAGGELEGEE